MSLMIGRWTIGVIILLAVGLRVSGLDEVPAGFSENEAAIGYNAYSIFKTGRDEEGKLLPIVFRSFGDYKLALPIYLTVPPIAIMGLTKEAVRSVSVFFGITSVYLIYLVARSLFGDRRVAGLAALMLAVSPWHVQLSRFDAAISVAMCLFLFQLLLIFTPMRRRVQLAGIGIGQALMLLAHPAMGIISLPVSIFGLMGGWRKQPKPNFWLVVAVVGCWLVLGILTIRSGKAYFWDKAFFREVGFTNRINQLRGYALDYTHSNWLGKITQNKIIIFSDQVTRNYLSAFNTYYWFSKSEVEEKNYASSFGKFYSPELILFLLGVYSLVKTGISGRKYLWLMIWLAPLPGILGWGRDPAEKWFLFMIPFYLLAALGWGRFLAKHGLINIVVWLVLALSVSTFFHYYFVHYPVSSTVNWSYGYEQVANRIKRINLNYDKIIISDNLASKPYVFTLFFLGVDPKEYQDMEKERGGSGFISTSKFGKYEFRSIVWGREVMDDRVLIVASNQEGSGPKEHLIDSVYVSPTYSLDLYSLKK